MNEGRNEIYQDAVILSGTEPCLVEQINTEKMTAPSESKWKYYETYYLQKKECPHGIVVDEYGNIRDGYITYLLAQKYGVCPNVYEAWTNQPLRKVVTGRHVSLKNGTVKIHCKKSYRWIYTLRAPVVQGDILLAKTKQGNRMIIVDSISYCIGRESFGTLRRIKRKIRAWNKCPYSVSFDEKNSNPNDKLEN